MDANESTSLRGARPGALFSAALAMLLLTTPAPAGAVVLYDQYNNAGVAAVADITSQDFEASNDGYDAQAADDFVVPAGVRWKVTGVDVDGQYSAAGPAASVHVNFYSNAAGNLPGALVASRPANTFVQGPAAGDFVITLTTPVVLSPGTYWLSVQARQDVTPAGQWYWHNRTVVVNAGSAWQNPGNSFGTGCTSWGRKTTCLPNQAGADQVFRLNGSPVKILTVAKDGSGSGSVFATGINCGGDCTEDYDAGAVVTLTAAPDAGSGFTRWDNCDNPSGNTCEITLNADERVTATFTAQRTLSVGLAGTGAGVVTSSPAGIDCGADCTEVYEQGTSVALAASPSAGSTFAGFAGACTGTACVLDLNEAKGVTATFNLITETTITKQKVKPEAGKAKFKFTGVGGSGAPSFECKLDKAPYKACTSPAKYKHLDSGRHKFRVRAKDSTGAVDATPAKSKFRID